MTGCSAVGSVSVLGAEGHVFKSHHSEKSYFDLISYIEDLQKFWVSSSTVDRLAYNEKVKGSNPLALIGLFDIEGSSLKIRDPKNKIILLCKFYIHF